MVHISWLLLEISSGQSIQLIKRGWRQTVTYSGIVLEASFREEVLQLGNEVTDLLLGDP